MKIVEARAISQLRPDRIGNGSAAQNKDPIPAVWRMCLSYNEPHTVFEVELREPLKSLASKKYTVGLNGMVEFDTFSAPLLLPAIDSDQSLRVRRKDPRLGKVPLSNHNNERPSLSD
jgi:hypothetical protein